MSTTSSAFIDGDEHFQIKNLKQVRGLAFNQKDKLLYGYYYQGNIIFIYNIKKKLVSFLPQKSGVYQGSLEDIAYNVHDGSLYGIDAKKNKLVRINLTNGKFDIVHSIPQPCFGLTYHEKEKLLYCNSQETIWSINIKTGDIFLRGAIKVTGIQGLAYSSNKELIYAVQPQTNSLYSFSSSSCIDEYCKLSLIYKVSDSLTSRLQFKKVDDSSLSLPLFALAFDDQEEVFYISSSSFLFKVSLIDGVAHDFHLNDIKNKLLGELYTEYSIPMNIIKNTMDVTFFSSGILEDRGKKLSYVLDTSQDSKFIFTSYSGVNFPIENIQNVWFRGKPFSIRYSVVAY